MLISFPGCRYSFKPHQRDANRPKSTTIPLVGWVTAHKARVKPSGVSCFHCDRNNYTTLGTMLKDLLH